MTKKPPKGWHPGRKPGRPPLKVAKYLRARFKGLNQKEAAIEAGYARKGAAVRGHELERLPEVQKEIQRALKSNRITIERLIKEYAKGLKEGELDKHSFYLKELSKLLKMTPENESQTPLTPAVTFAIYQNAIARGVFHARERTGDHEG